MKIKKRYSKVAIIVPAYNEHKNIERLIKQINFYLKGVNIYVVDDSPDFKTKDILNIYLPYHNISYNSPLLP